ncbi:hypothetical protein [Mesorhizobium sp.]|uniref:hypothetical protein n=1 Tax=Mesorhizobium sp. TaxID=1871066 RepID=UPI0025EA11E2|nr:hypothetical protein [Mesorhizobium sp.]
MHQRTASSQFMAASGIERNHMLDHPRQLSGDNCVRRHVPGHNDLDLLVRVSDAPTTAAAKAQLDERDGAFGHSLARFARPPFQVDNLQPR